jgi:hypothetical protein
MYNERIEQLIDAALADGMLTEKEKQVLFKRAQEQGIDLDEFEMVLDARLVMLQKAERANAQRSAPNSGKYGDVRKCPACGAMVAALAGACTDCGYEFSGVESNLSSVQLYKKIEEIQERYALKISGITDATLMGDNAKWELRKQRALAISQAITTFTIPNAKADLFEFVTSMQAQMMNDTIHKLLGNAYLTKYNEAIIKVRLMFPKDPLFMQILSEQDAVRARYAQVHSKQKGNGLKPSIKYMLWCFGVAIGLWCLGGILIYFFE